MASATESLQHAAELSRIAEELETGLQSRIRDFEADAAKAREAFEQEIRGERDKVREARQEAAAAIRRAACGRMIRRKSRVRLMPSARPASHWPRSTETMPPRKTSAKKALDWMPSAASAAPKDDRVIPKAIGKP